MFSKKEYDKNYIREHWEEHLKRNRKYNKTEKKHLAHLRWYAKLKQTVISAYGGKCIKCNYLDIRALQIDHINGDGASHRKQTGAGSRFYQWLKNNNFPEGFQILCANCNSIKRVENLEFGNKKK